jgi:hypothetical protein
MILCFASDFNNIHCSVHPDYDSVFCFWSKHRIIIRMDSTMDIIEIRSKTQNHNPDGQYNGYYWNQKQNTESQYCPSGLWFCVLLLISIISIVPTIQIMILCFASDFNNIHCTQWILLKSEAKHRITIRMDSTMDIIEIRSKTQNHNPDIVLSIQIGILCFASDFNNIHCTNHSDCDSVFCFWFQ